MANLWIRSQNKEELVKIGHIYCYEGYDPFDEYGGFTVHEIWANKEEIELGRYKTKERCIEIIDEIQSLLVRNDKVVYEMPKE